MLCRYCELEIVQNNFINNSALKYRTNFLNNIMSFYGLNDATINQILRTDMLFHVDINQFLVPCSVHLLQ